ncbi:Eukaryotic translation initiation factor 4E-binding protein Mextli [Amphibalanus amphitrite]|uniref:Eukaryotic translation initiation factor 4E-binding protein Mextli n=2 Tax=Amphibalanus amphitrite TaxID=1232801 RepID=A0A6A4VXA9_AMPAM|nr:eukaryotic translation initiation factor 4E-binding protein Mextli-like isoform X10 [Amphibalanus amphitrite]KAF0295492.1 Eukaryotic translation initiation factor 4E-binding protein Mextli [Amphibalanus amphitrite]
MSSIKSMRVGKVEKPRPLKSASSSSIVGKGVDDVLADLEKVCRMIASETFTSATSSAITSLSFHMKMMGHQLEGICKDELDKRFVHLRNGCRDDRLDRASRVRLLELVELRAQHTPWSCNENVTNYYRQMLQLIESQPAAVAASPLCEAPPASSPLSPTLAEPPQLPPLLTPGEVIRGSGKYPKPTKIQGKYKDEVVIRNCDSGKVAAGAKERLVQITGPAEENVLRARELIEEVIRRNASPARDERGSTYSLTAGESTGSLNSANSDENGGPRKNGSNDFGSLGEFKYTVFVGEHTIKLTGKNVDIVNTAKLVLDEYFNSALSCDPDACGLDTVPEADPNLLGAGDSQVRDCPSPTELIAAEACVVTTPPSGPPSQPPSLLSLRQPEPPVTTQSQPQEKAPAQPEPRRTTTIYSRRLPVAASATAEVPTAAPSAGPANTANAERGSSKPATRSYTRPELLMYSRSAVARYPPRGWAEVRERHPTITRASAKVFDPEEFSARPRQTAVFCRQGSAESASRSPTPP